MKWQKMDGWMESCDRQMEGGRLTVSVRLSAFSFWSLRACCRARISVLCSFTASSTAWRDSELRCSERSLQEKKDAAPPLLFISWRSFCTSSREKFSSALARGSPPHLCFTSFHLRLAYTGSENILIFPRIPSEKLWRICQNCCGCVGRSFVAEIF